MLVRDKDSQEGYIHICRDSYKYNEKALKNRLPIYLHDVKAYTLIKCERGYELKDIKYCPYCGVEIESDEYKNERG